MIGTLLIDGPEAHGPVTRFCFFVTACRASTSARIPQIRNEMIDIIQQQVAPRAVCLNSVRSGTWAKLFNLSPRLSASAPA